MIDQRLDPLRDLREDKSGPASGEHILSLEEETELNHDIENDPKLLKAIDLEQVTEETDFPTFIGESYNSEFLAENMEDGFANEQDLYEEEGFENRDILGDALRKKAWQRAENLESVPLYTKDEFKLMSECASYRAIVDLPENVKKSQPMFTKDIPLSDEKIAQHIAAYRQCKQNNEWSNYNQDDLNFMRKCAQWDYFKRNILKNQNPPVYADGKPLSEDDVRELSDEFNNLRRENPKAFAELKFESGEWKKNYFKWKPGEYKGKKQWSSSKSLPIGGGQTSRTKYVSQKEPSVLDGESYYVINRTHTISTEDGPISYVDINIKNLSTKSENSPIYSASPSK